MKMNSKLFWIVTLIVFSITGHAQQYRLASPDGKIHVEIDVGKEVRWKATYEQTPVIASSPVSMVVNGQTLGIDPVVRSKKENQVRTHIRSVVPRKSGILEDHYNELQLNFKGGYAIHFRVYNDGVAYRFQTDLKKDITVDGENVKVNFASPSRVFFPEEESLISHYERSYIDTTLSSIASGRFCSLPVLVRTQEKVNVLITEADLFDYPNMFLSGTGTDALTARFPNVVLEAKPHPDRPDRNEVITKEAPYIARTKGSRNFPWRVFIITPHDGDLVSSELVFKLSRPVALSETAWIKPGKVAWDWYNANNIYGVDFRAGLNTETYKYYIDFASKFGLEYVILDEGWSKTTTDLTAANPDINLQELIHYGKSKNVGIILWMLWKPLDENLETLLDRFASWGAKGIKVDFMQRADQDMVNYYERVAREAGKRKLLVDFHGAYKPTGLHRTYPNVITFEGVKGLENNKWSRQITPEHNVTLPFIRMAAGPMDYTPGSMINANQKSFRSIFDTPMSMGTRCHQVAMYVIYESPLQMLADSPTNYYRETETTSFISRIPTVWDTTVVLDASVGDYILMARKREGTWYVGAMTDWTARELMLDCSFLGEGNYIAEIMQDGMNADRHGNDYKTYAQAVTNKSKLKLSMAPGGGWAAIIRKQ